MTSEFYSNALSSALLSSTFNLIRENTAAEEEHPGSELTGLSAHGSSGAHGILCISDSVCGYCASHGSKWHILEIIEFISA